MRKQTEEFLRILTEIVFIVEGLKEDISRQKAVSAGNKLPSNHLEVEEHINMIMRKASGYIKLPTDIMDLTNYIFDLLNRASQVDLAAGEVGKPKIYDIVYKLSLVSEGSKSEKSVPFDDLHNRIRRDFNNYFIIPDIIISTEVIRSYFNRQWAFNTINKSNLKDENITRIKQLKQK